MPSPPGLPSGTSFRQAKRVVPCETPSLRPRPGSGVRRSKFTLQLRPTGVVIPLPEEGRPPKSASGHRNDVGVLDDGAPGHLRVCVDRGAVDVEAPRGHLSRVTNVFVVFVKPKGKGLACVPGGRTGATVSYGRKRGTSQVGVSPRSPLRPQVFTEKRGPSPVFSAIVRILIPLGKASRDARHPRAGTAHSCLVWNSAGPRCTAPVCPRGPVRVRPPIEVWPRTGPTAPEVVLAVGMRVAVAGPTARREPVIVRTPLQTPGGSPPTETGVFIRVTGPEGLSV